MKKSIQLFLFLLLLVILSGCFSKEETARSTDKQERVELTVSAAASLQNALLEVKKEFEKEHPDIMVTFNFGGSGALKQQISQGAPADLFLSAAEDQFDELVKEELIDKENATDLVSNELVLIVPASSKKDIQTFHDITETERFALGTPETVPAGKYAKQALKSLNIWQKIENRAVYAKDVRQVLTYVETGNADAGIVYKTDAQISSKVKLADTAKKETHDPIIYPAGIVSHTSYPQEAKQFYQFLQAQKSMEIFEKYGFKGLT
ncbi:molybdate ABC transporter substrate-binding protein [Bacillus xiapuensis]|uniref:molybdate ABC transporter substrate-binding protein n=1 Tax=Bacillus xiapuensis TaxID=2014075 RepID=UPI000C238486|nr:molybdate ABC transporter substrate-binding protein [Bacillus xiapuensis]